MLAKVRSVADRMVERVAPRVEADALAAICNCLGGSTGYKWITGPGCDAWGNKYTQRCNSSCGSCTFYKCGWVCG